MANITVLAVEADHPAFPEGTRVGVGEASGVTWRPMKLLVYNKAARSCAGDTAAGHKQPPIGVTP